MDKFKRKYYSLLREFVKYEDLPNSPPYGFWVSPNGRFEVVGRFLHSRVAERIVHKFYSNLHDSKKTDEAEFLISKQWVRVVLEDGKIRAQTTFVDAGQIEINPNTMHILANGWYKVKLTKKANDALKDLAMWYNISVHNIEID